MDTVLQVYLPKNHHVWGISDDDMKDCGLNVLPSIDFVRDRIRKKKGHALDEGVLSLIKGLLALAFNDCITKSPQGKNFTAFGVCKKTIAFLNESFEVNANALKTSYSNSPEECSRKYKTLQDCVNELFAIASENANKNDYVSRAVLTGVIEDTILTYSTIPIEGDDLENEIIRYQNIFVDEMHLESRNGFHASLKDIFVEPNFCYMRNGSTAITNDFTITEFVEMFACGQIEVVAPELSNKTKVLTLLGQPGSGKTSLLASFADKHAHGQFCQNVGNFYCIRLSNLADSSFAESRNPISFLRKRLKLPNARFDDCLIMLDGLDELCLLLSRDETVGSFYSKILDGVSAFKNCRVLITSRFNYIDLSKINDKASLLVEVKSLNRSKADTMIEKLQDTRSQPINETVINQIEKNFEVFDFLSVPLLLYTILALEITVDETEGIGSLYDRIFEEIAKKPYGDGKTPEYNGTIDSRELARCLALEMRRKSRKYLSSAEAENILKRNTLESVPENLKKKVCANYGMTFYYKNASDENFAPEFMHRTFAEFLAAEGIYLKLAEAVESAKSVDCNQWWSDFDYMLGAERLSNEVLAFFKYKVESGKVSKSKIIETMSKWLFESYLPYGMLYRSGRETEESSFKKASMLLLSYWSMMKTVAEGKPILDNPTNAQSLFNGMEEALHYSSFTVSFTNENITLCDLSGMNLSDCDFSGAVLKGCNLHSTNLENSILVNVDLSFANMVNTNLSGAKVNGCHLECARLDGTASNWKNRSKSTVFIEEQQLTLYPQLKECRYTFITPTHNPSKDPWVIFNPKTAYDKDHTTTVVRLFDTREWGYLYRKEALKQAASDGEIYYYSVTETC
ncbi:MAG: pentapeptide repeat-containing protein [Gordonibacter sp.]|uniref:pentapeptide repeat-containing protein n=1 Tax=Gordonibacter sp. TaxID=1968902 RepID=UPI002FC930D4